MKKPPAKTKGKRRKSCGVGFAEWDLAAHEDLHDLANRVAATFLESIEKKIDGKAGTIVDKMIAEGMKIATSEYKCLAYLAIDWNFAGKVITDPTRVCVEVPIGPTDDDSPRWDFSIAGIVNEMLDANIRRDGTFDLGEASQKNFARLSASLRKLADSLDHAVANSGNGKP